MYEKNSACGYWQSNRWAISFDMFSPRFDWYLHYHILSVCSCILIYVTKWEGIIVFSLKIICIDYNVTKQIMCSQMNPTVSALSESIQTIWDRSVKNSFQLILELTWIHLIWIFLILDLSVSLSVWLPYRKVTELTFTIW